MRFPIYLAVAAFGVLTLAGCDFGPGMDKVNGPVVVQAGKPAAKASTVNGSITVEPKAQASHVSTVNGGIHIGQDASFAKATTVNGSISIGERAHGEKATTVNGDIDLLAGAELTGGAITVSGKVGLATGSHVGGGITNVNGSITLDHAKVAGGIQTVEGDVTIGSGSIVSGGIHVRKSTGISVSLPADKPRIVIMAGASVEGTLQFDHAVDLLVAPGAKIGPVVGATPQPYKGQ